MEVNSVEVVSEKIEQLLESKNPKARKLCMISLRNLCAHGKEFQNFIILHSELNNFLHKLLRDNKYQDNEDLKTLGLQLLANSIVDNPKNQKILWEKYGNCLLENSTTSPLGSRTNIIAMIIFNIFKGGTNILEESEVLHTCLRIWDAIIDQKSAYNFEFLHFLFEDFLVTNGRKTVGCYAQLGLANRITFLDYLSNYLQQDSPNGVVNEFILKYVSKEFKMMSDQLFRQVGLSNSSAVQSNNLEPRLAYASLRVIATVTGSNHYQHIFYSDHSLFINISGLLRCLVSAAKSAKEGSELKPLNKLEHVAITSKVSYDFETKISFELKTLLLRCITNLLYENVKNQEYCYDLDLMPVLLDCTNMDARNPLMKEWSILAIRNACYNYPKNQEIVGNLKQEGVIQNNVLSDLNLELGALRVQINGN